MADLVIRGGTVVDGTGSRRADVAVADGVIVEVGAGLSGDRELDAGGCFVVPGLVDLHAHLREPGREEAETIETGARAAALGGFTAVVAMPNTEPAIDNASTVRDILEMGKKALCDVHPAGAITVGRQGEQLAPMAEMARLGVRMFTDDGRGVQDPRLMRRAMEYATGLSVDVVLAQHCEDERLSEGGHMNEGAWSSRLGMGGIPNAAEDLMVSRDIELARLTGAAVHFQHLSTEGSVALVRDAKAAGVAATAEATPHHLSLTDAEVANFDPRFKVNPPLRTDRDVAAVKAAVGDGTIDAIATDHAPHEPEAKDQPFDQARPGMIGLETALSVAVTELDLGPVELIRRLSVAPARIAGVDEVHGGPIGAGRAANLCVFDPTETWTVEPGRSASRSRNTPFAGRELSGRVRHTVLRGEPVVVEAEPVR